MAQQVTFALCLPLKSSRSPLLLKQGRSVASVWVGPMESGGPPGGRPWGWTPRSIGKELSQIRRASRGSPAELTVWWLEVASRPKSSTPSWCLSRGPSDMYQAPSWPHCSTPGTLDAQSQDQAMHGWTPTSTLSVCPN